MAHPIEQADFGMIERAVSEWPEDWPDRWRERMGIVADDTRRHTILSAYRDAYELTIQEAAALGVSRELQERGRTRQHGGVKRRLLNAGCLGTAILSGLVFALWFRSYYWDDGFDWRTHQFAVAVGSARGRIHIMSVPPENFTDKGLTLSMTMLEELDSEDIIPDVDWFYYKEFSWNPGRGHLMGFPHALVLSVCLIPSAIWVVSRARHRVASQHCRCCGYDLRGTPGSECPECGATARPLSPR